MPRRAEKLAPLLDGFERFAQDTGRDAFTLAELNEAARRWDANQRSDTR